MSKAPKPSKSEGRKVGAKKPAKALKKPMNMGASSPAHKGHTRRSRAKDRAIRTGVLTDLKPPLPHEIKNSKTDFSAVTLNRFYNRPEHYIAYGAFYLTAAIYWLKLHHRPMPVDAIKVLEEEIEKITQKKAALLLEWELSPEVARLVVDFSHRAWLVDFSDKVWGCKNPDEFFSNEKIRERALIVSAKHDWSRQLETLQIPFISKSAELDPAAFVHRFHGAVIEKTSGMDAWKVGPAEWARKIIPLWAVSPNQSYFDPTGRLTGKIPPLCIWSGPAIVRYFNLPVGDATAMRRIGRLGLVKTHESLHFGLEEIIRRGKKTLRFVK